MQCFHWRLGEDLFARKAQGVSRAWFCTFRWSMRPMWKGKNLFIYYYSVLSRLSVLSFDTEFTELIKNENAGSSECITWKLVDISICKRRIGEENIGTKGWLLWFCQRIIWALGAWVWPFSTSLCMKTYIYYHHHHHQPIISPSSLNLTPFDPLFPHPKTCTFLCVFPNIESNGMNKIIIWWFYFLVKHMFKCFIF